jgi:hypothetical protein
MDEQIERTLARASAGMSCCADVWASIADATREPVFRVIDSLRLCDSCIGHLSDYIERTAVPVDHPTGFPPVERQLFSA